MFPEKYLESIRWKPNELNIIKDNWPRLSEEQIQKKFLPHRAVRGIREQRQKLGLYIKMQKHQIWTEEETQILLNVWKDYNQREISEKFIPSKTPVQINQKKMHMGLKKPPVWTNEQRATLVEYGASMTRGELQTKFFPEKSVDQISNMRKHLGVNRTEYKKLKKTVDSKFN